VKAVTKHKILQSGNPAITPAGTSSNVLTKETNLEAEPQKSLTVTGVKQN
jgi:hypothetical protein